MVQFYCKRSSPIRKNGMGEKSNPQPKYIPINKPGTSKLKEQKSNASSFIDAAFKVLRTESQTYDGLSTTGEEELQVLDLDKIATISPKPVELTLPELKKDGAGKFLKTSKSPKPLNETELIEQKAQNTAVREERGRRKAIHFIEVEEAESDTTLDLILEEEVKMQVSDITTTDSDKSVK